MGLTVVNVDPEFWRGKRVLITGHTGFKGSWLSLWLQSMAVELYGLALPPPTTPALFDEARVGPGMVSLIGDIRDYPTVESAIRDCRPEIIFHLAAQPLVRHSYNAPMETYAINVMGLVHVLEAARQLGNVRAIVNVTSDKCYQNNEWVWGYREHEAMGGRDPYSSSKGCSELITHAYRQSFFGASGTALGSARAGNVIGGGDWAADRLVPDILRALGQGQPPAIRHPHAIRPWQHVIEPLSGYLVLAERLYADGQVWAEGWNFGPHDDDARPVQWIADRLVQAWGDDASWVHDGAAHLHEAHHLKLDISKAKATLYWQPRWRLGTALTLVMDWHRAWLEKADIQPLCLAQIRQHQATA